MGTLIRHAGLRQPVVAIVPLAVPMIQPSVRALLMPAVGAAPLAEPGLHAAGQAAIALSTITVLADPEHRMASAAAANPLPENHFARNVHARPQAGLDNGNRSWQVRTSFDDW